jgi:hypothetical protein
VSKTTITLLATTIPLWPAFRISPAFAEKTAVIRLDYPGAVLIIDNETKGVNDSATLTVQAGLHYMTLLPPDRDGRWLPPVQSCPFVLAEDESLVIRQGDVRPLQVTTVPEASEIFLNGHPAGRSPLALSIIRGIDSTLSVAKIGYRRLTFRLDDPRLQVPLLNLSLEPAGSNLTPEVAATGKDQRPGVSPGWLPYATLSYFIGATALGFYTKERADDLFDDYRHTSSRDDMNRLFNGAERMDNRARILWVSGQVALGATIFLFFRNLRGDQGKRPPPALKLGRSGESPLIITWYFGDTVRR